MCSVHQHKKMYNRWISSSRRENRQHLPIRTHKIWHLVLKPEESYCPLPPGKTKEEHPPRAPECADGAETSTNVSGWASFVRALTWCFAEKCSYDEKSWHNKREKLTNIRIHIYIYSERNKWREWALGFARFFLYFGCLQHTRRGEQVKPSTALAVSLRSVSKPET